MAFSIPCPDCEGTGICTTTQAGMPSATPHSCCGDCDRRFVPAGSVPKGFLVLDGKAVIGTGRIEVKFWRWLWWRIGFRRHL